MHSHTLRRLFVFRREEKFTEAKTQIAIIRSSEYGSLKHAFDERVARQVKHRCF
jgi:hypothetical protein